MNFKELIQLASAQTIVLPKPEREVLYLLTDSRQALVQNESVFFAISGANHDGHQFIQALYERGCRQFVVEKIPEISLPDANIGLVDYSIHALQAVAAAHRQQFNFPVIGITGSNGKTIVKEWLSQILVSRLKVVKSPKSYNSQLGVPISVWQLKEDYQVALIEAGISRPGEMENLEEVIQPSIGIFTNLGPAHDQGFTDRMHKAEEKAKLFVKADFVVYRKDYPEIDQVLSAQTSKSALISWTTKETLPAKYMVTFQAKGEESRLQVRQGARLWQFDAAFTDSASLENLTHCIIYLLFTNWSEADIQQGIWQLKQVSMRMELKEGINQCYLLDDSYSNDLSGLKLALDYLQRQSQNESNTVIISDLLESAYADEELYSKVAQLLQIYGIKKLILIGERSGAHLQKFKMEGGNLTHYNSTEAFLAALQTSDFFRENILVKGARKFGFERIVRKLQQKITSTTLEINLDAIIHNLNYIRGLLEPQTRLMVMVKAFSYGGSTFEIANLLQYHRVDYLAVAYADEGVTLRQHGINIPVLVLNPSPEAFGLMIEYKLEPEIYNMSMLKQWHATARQYLNVPKIHIKLDTGMHRLGFMVSEMNELLLFLQENKSIKLSSVFSHLVASEDELEDKFSLHQIEQFEDMYQQISKVLGYFPLKHILNSGGILRLPQYQFDMVRLGIGLYGVDVRAGVNSALRPISRLKTTISQIKTLKAGETVGYNRRGKINEATRVATLAIGYADGLDRRLGNGNLKVYIQGKAVPTIGNICMDMCMVNIGNIDVEEGDEVIIFGEEQAVSVLAASMRTIPYEVLTNISARVKRVFYSET